MLALIFIWIMFGIAAAIVASNRGGNGCLYFILGVFLGPIGFLLAFTEGSTCPHCRSRIHEKAVKCPKCQSLLLMPEPPERVIAPPIEDIAIQPMAETSPRTQKVYTISIWVFAVIVLLSVFNAYNSKEPTKSESPDTGIDQSATTIEDVVDTVRQSEVSPTAKPATKPWRSVESQKVGNTLIYTGQSKGQLEFALREYSISESFNKDSTKSTCRYKAENKEIEVVYSLDNASGRWASSRIRVR